MQYIREHIYEPEVVQLLQQTTAAPSAPYEVRGLGESGQRYALSLATTNAVQQIDNHTHFMRYPFTARMCVDDMQELVRLYASTAARSHQVGMMELCCSQVIRLSLCVCGPLVNKSKTEPEVRALIVERLLEVMEISMDTRPPPPPHAASNLLRVVYVFAPSAPDWDTDLNTSPFFILHWPFVAVYMAQMAELCEMLSTATGARIVPRYSEDGLCTMLNTRIHPKPILAGCPERTQLYLEYVDHYGCGDDDSDIRVDLGPYGVCHVPNNRFTSVLPFLATINALFTDTIMHTIKRAGLGVDLPGTPEAIRIVVANMLACLNASRRLGTQSQSEIGTYLYHMTNGTGFSQWYEWLGRSITTTPWHEWYHQWRSMQYDVMSKAQANRRLCTLAHSDNADQFRKTVQQSAVFDATVDSLTGTDTSLAGFKDMVRMAGCLSHYDLALYIASEMHGTAFATGTQGSVSWWFFDADIHRWRLDPGLSYITQQIQKALRGLQSQIKTTIMSKAAPTRASGRLSALVHFPEVTKCSETMCVAVAWLEEEMGSATNINNIVRLLAGQMWKDKALFDTVNDHLIPFKNGVLDLLEGRLRPGRASDMLRRGPMYEYVPYHEDRTDVTEAEFVLTCIFPDKNVLAFALNVLSSTLRKRNFNKHFYILAGGTNAGKSFLMSLMNVVLGDLFCTLPVTALTCRESDPAGHTDHLAKTEGCNLVICNEPDAHTQTILPDKMKLFTSDSDKLMVREIYGHAQEIVITWKLFLACNNIPLISSLDTASVARTLVIPFVSEFADPAHVSGDMDRQFQDRRFIAKRHLTTDDKCALARGLMAILVENYFQSDMNNRMHALRIPREIRMRSEAYHKELLGFRYWVRAFVRPVAPLNDLYFLPRYVDLFLRKWATDIRSAIGRGIHCNRAARPGDAQTRGSDAWVREQSLLLMASAQRSFKTKDGHNQMYTMSSSETAGFWAVDVDLIKSRYLQQRKRRLADMVNAHKTVPQTGDNAAAAAEGEEKQDKSKSRYPRYGVPVGLSASSSIPTLDPQLVTQEISNALGVPNFGDYWVGFAVILEDGSSPLQSCHQPEHLFGQLGRTYTAAATMWQARYGTPPPYWGVIDHADMQRIQEQLTSNPERPNLSALKYTCYQAGAKRDTELCPEASAELAAAVAKEENIYDPVTAGTLITNLQKADALIMDQLSQDARIRSFEAGSVLRKRRLTTVETGGYQVPSKRRCVNQAMFYRGACPEIVDYTQLGRRVPLPVDVYTVEDEHRGPQGQSTSGVVRVVRAAPAPASAPTAARVDLAVPPVVDVAAAVAAATVVEADDKHVDADDVDVMSEDSVEEIRSDGGGSESSESVDEPLLVEIETKPVDLAAAAGCGTGEESEQARPVDKQELEQIQLVPEPEIGGLCAQLEKQETKFEEFATMLERVVPGVSTESAAAAVGDAMEIVAEEMAPEQAMEIDEPVVAAEEAVVPEQVTDAVQVTVPDEVVQVEQPVAPSAVVEEAAVQVEQVVTDAVESDEIVETEAVVEVPAVVEEAAVQVGQVVTDAVEPDQTMEIEPVVVVAEETTVAEQIMEIEPVVEQVVVVAEETTVTEQIMEIEPVVEQVVVVAEETTVAEQTVEIVPVPVVVEEVAAPVVEQTMEIEPVAVVPEQITEIEQVVEEAEMQTEPVPEPIEPVVAAPVVEEAEMPTEQVVAVQVEQVVVEQTMEIEPVAVVLAEQTTEIEQVPLVEPAVVQEAEIQIEPVPEQIEQVVAAPVVEEAEMQMVATENPATFTMFVPDLEEAE